MADAKIREVFTVNGQEVTLALEANDTLLTALRNNGYTEVKNGCSEGQCGACIVQLDGRPVNSCQALALSAKKKKITTSKGIGNYARVSVIQEAYVEAGAVQCGFCIPGFIVTTDALLRENPNPSDEEIRFYLSGNLCRCTGYVKIIDAVKLAASRMKKA
ncbi:MAG: (2Fe-2S)-binding protein [Spirochaetota bacterium]|jgi:aerobic-type carbon monoxide dehydrogenase small subunit (CoxS/CutS family)|nr:(2Fe-2S)-binding protein [Spirochaetota bacterium]